MGSRPLNRGAPRGVARGGSKRLSNNEKWPRNGSPGHGFGSRSLKSEPFFVENPFPATPGPGETDKKMQIARKKHPNIKKNVTPPPPPPWRPPKIFGCPNWGLLVLGPGQAARTGESGRPTDHTSQAGHSVPARLVRPGAGKRIGIGGNKPHKQKLVGEQFKNVGNVSVRFCDLLGLPGPRGGRKRILREK